MYAELNLEGRLTADPEFRVGKEDREYVTLRLAVNQKLGPQENTTFYNCTGGEYIAKRIKKAGLTKGQPLHVSGTLTGREYEDRNGIKRFSLDVGIGNWHFVGSKPKDAADNAAAEAPANSGGSISGEVSISNDDDELPL